MKGTSYRAAVAVLLFILWTFLPLCCGAEDDRPRVLLLYSSEEYGSLQRGEDRLKNYTTALMKAGIIAVPSAPVHIVPLSSVDGLLIPGGRAITSSLYQKSTDEDISETDPEFDRYELSVLNEAWNLDMPIVAVCRGEELLNVSRGGSLYDDLPADIGIRDGVEHRDPRTRQETCHIITINAGTMLYSILNAPVKIVNSHHHHAVKDLGRDLTVTACSPDGIIECIEAPGRTFCLGLQFHPERLITRDRVFMKIFLRLHDEALQFHRRTKDGR